MSWCQTAKKEALWQVSEGRVRTAITGSISNPILAMAIGPRRTRNRATRPPLPVDQVARSTKFSPRKQLNFGAFTGSSSILVDIDWAA
ncbi:hypothetical protein PhaeoP24_03888 (plasmid) [Phaeobacter inhibens]|jgi:hypothetical protein|nr:hypothetical protein PhaeoP24_03888 [Phaeobacter inhibens]